MSLRLWNAILGGAQVVTATANLADLIGTTPALWAVLIVGALQTGTAIYRRGTPSVSPKQLARRAYIAYGDSVGWRNHQGNPMPAWLDLPEHIRDAWTAAAAAAREL